MSEFLSSIVKLGSIPIDVFDKKFWFMLVKNSVALQSNIFFFFFDLFIVFVVEGDSDGDTDKMHLILLSGLFLPVDLTILTGDTVLTVWLDGILYYLIEN